MNIFNMELGQLFTKGKSAHGMIVQQVNDIHKYVFF